MRATFHDLPYNYERVIADDGRVVVRVAPRPARHDERSCIDPAA